jgi:hypothetical protein
LVFLTTLAYLVYLLRSRGQETDSSHSAPFGGQSSENTR